jgi:L-asparaginase
VKILILFCGGTLVMEENASGALVTPPPEKALATLRRMEPRLQNAADLWFSWIDNIDSTNMSPEHWDRIAQVIGENYDSYDGFIVTHGTDTMAYTASALTWSLGNLGKPVILTGAQIPGSRLESDAHRNFVNAVRVATLDLSGVILVFGEEILLGCRATKVSESKLDAFQSVNRPRLGEIRTEIRLEEDHPRRRPEPLEVRPGFEGQVAVLSLAPGKPVSMLVALLQSGIRGLVLRGYGPGNIPYQYLEILHSARELEVPVVVHSQCMEGITAMHRYDVGRRAIEMGAIEAYDMSLEAAVTKLMWVLRRETACARIREIMQTDLAGEIRRETVR